MELTFNTVTAEQEDGGHALILELCHDDGTESYEGDSLTLRVHSWQEEDTKHPAWLKSLTGKTVRVTIEEI